MTQAAGWYIVNLDHYCWINELINKRVEKIIDISSKTEYNTLNIIDIINKKKKLKLENGWHRKYK